MKLLSGFDPADLIIPVFLSLDEQDANPSITPGNQKGEPAEALFKKVADFGASDVCFFPVKRKKSSHPDNIREDAAKIGRAISAAKNAAPGVTVWIDLCICQLQPGGECFLEHDRSGQGRDTIALLVEMASIYRKAGVDVIMPSGMQENLTALLAHELAGINVVPQSAKFSSGYYDVFRSLSETAKSDDRKLSYQIETPNLRQALSAISRDLADGANGIMIKPLFGYLDVLYAAKKLTENLFCFSSAGEDAMISGAAERGWLDYERVTLELFTSAKRAGARKILTFAAKNWLR